MAAPAASAASAAPQSFASHSGPQSFASHSGPQSFAPVGAHGGHGEEETTQQAVQKVVYYLDVKFDHIRVKPKTRNPDRQKQCFPIKYVDSQSKGGRNLQELTVSFCLGHPVQSLVNTIISPAKAYQRDLSMPPENPHNLQIGIKFTDPEMVDWITNFNAALLQQLKDTGVTQVDPMRPDIPVEALDEQFKSPFNKTDDGYVGYFAFTDDTLRNKPSQGRPSKMPVFEVQPYDYDEGENKLILYQEERRQIHYSDIVPQSDYCMVIFSLGAMRLDNMTMGNKGTRFPFIGSKLYLEKLTVLKTREVEAAVPVDYNDMASIMSSRFNVQVVKGAETASAEGEGEGADGEGFDHQSKRARGE